MASATFIPLSKYLTTTYRPDCDYIDGEVKERTLGTRAHGYLQGIRFAIFSPTWTPGILLLARGFALVSP